MITSLLILAEVRLDTDDLASVSELLTEVLSIAREAGDRLALRRRLAHMAAVVATHQPERALRLAGAAAVARSTIGSDLTPVERDRLGQWQAVVRRALGETASAAAWAEGQCQSLVQAAHQAQALARDPLATGGGRSTTGRGVGAPVCTTTRASSQSHPDVEQNMARWRLAAPAPASANAVGRHTLAECTSNDAFE